MEAVDIKKKKFSSVDGVFHPEPCIMGLKTQQKEGDSELWRILASILDEKQNPGIHLWAAPLQ